MKVAIDREGNHAKLYVSHFYNDLQKNHDHRCYYCGRYSASKQAKSNHKKEHMKEGDL